MKEKGTILIVTLVASLISIKNVSAYIDPGAGASVIGSMWPLIVAAFTAIVAFLGKYFWNPIKSKFSKIFKLEKKEE